MSETFQSANPTNPFVSNELYFENVTAFKKRGALYALRRINDYFALLLGVFFFGLLVYLLILQTPKILKPYRKVMLFSMLINLVLLSTNILLQLRIRYYDGHIMITFLGATTYLGYKSYCYLTVWHYCMLTISASALPVQYYVRYSILKHQNPPNGCHLILYFLLAASLTSITGFTSSQLFCSESENPNGIDVSASWFSENPIPSLLVGQARSKANIAFQLADNGLFVIYVTVSYVIARMTTNELKKNLAEYNGKVRTIQRQLRRIFLGQAIVIVLFNSIDRLFSAFSSFYNIFGGQGSEITTIFQIWTPTFTLFCIILFMRNYRTYCLHFFCFYSPVQHSGSTTGPIVFTNAAGTNSMSTSRN